MIDFNVCLFLQYVFFITYKIFVFVGKMLTEDCLA